MGRYTVKKRLYAERIGNRLRGCILNSRFDQRTLCGLTDISEPTMSRILNGVKLPDIREIAELSIVLQIPMQELIGDGYGYSGDLDCPLNFGD